MVRLVRDGLAGALALVLSTLALVAGGDRGQVAPQPPSMPVAAAADVGTAMALARAQGTRVEVLGERTESRTVHADPKGSLTAELTVRPVRVKRHGGWVPTDPTLVPGVDNGLVPRTASVDLWFSGGGAGPMVRYGRGDTWLELSWPGILPIPAVSGDTARYTDVLPGVDLMLRADVDGYAQYVVVKSAQAARQPALAKLRLGLRANGLTVMVNASGGLAARDRAGALVLAAPTSLMWDSSPVPKRAVVQVGVERDALVLRPDPGLLAGPGTVYPVTVDPVWHTPGVQAWTSVLSGYPNQAYWNSSGEPPYAQVGKCYPDPDCRGIGIAWSYFQFDTSFLQGKYVIDARLLNTVVHSPDCTHYAEHEVYKAYDQIFPHTTWNNKPGGGFIARFGVPNVYGGCGGAKTASVPVTNTVNLGWTTTYLVKAVCDGFTAGCGVDPFAWRKYDSRETRLQVNYNAIPNLPSALSTDPPIPTPCTNCAGNRYFGDAEIRLRARLSDPDNEPVRPFWRVWFDGELTLTHWGGYKPSGEIHDYPVDLSDAHGQEVDWELVADDSLRSSAYADGGRFIVDRVPPAVRPGVSGLLYREDNQWHGGIGVPDTFTFDSAGVADVDHFRWGWSDPPTTKVDANRLGGTAKVTVTPTADGPRDLYVQSVDRAGHRSPTRVYRFYVRAGSGPLAQWSLDGSTADEAFLGDNHGTLYGQAMYGAGAVGLGLRLSGNEPGTNMSAPNAVRTDTSFSVSAWVKPEPSRAGQVMGAVSQDGELASGFYLSYRGDMNKWALLMVHRDGSGQPGTFAAAAVPPVPGQWTHLTGVFDRPANRIRLYVDGTLGAEAALPADFVPWHAAGSLYVGRQKCDGAHCDPWAGSIDEVKVFDRALQEAEVRALVGQDNVQVGHWKFDELAGASGRNVIDGAEMVVLHNGASFTGDSDGDRVADGGAVGGGLRLDGADDYAATSGPVVRTSQSFTVTAWVKLDRAPPQGWTYTAVAQDGVQVSGFLLWYRQNSGGGVWEFYTPSADSLSRPNDELVVSTVPAQLNVWTHLTAVYDRPAGQIRLYVNGAPAGTAARTLGFDAGGPLTAGRGWWNGGPTNLWPGMLDEIRVYGRTLADAEIRNIVSRDNVALGAWRLDGNAAGAKPGQNGTVNGTPEWVTGQTSMPDPADRAMRIAGGNASVSAPHTVDVTKSFSVAAWARLDSAGSRATVLSQDGNRVSSFKLQATPDRKWVWRMHGSDVDGGGTAAEVSGSAAQPGAWTHLVGVYDAPARQLLLYANGVLVGTTTHTQSWNLASGAIQIGRAKANGAAAEYFTGAIDDVLVYGRVLFAEEIRVMAGRDLALAHRWTLDEASGAAADSVGVRTASPAGEPARVAGRVGNAVRLDGVNDHVGTTGLDIGTDASFTVSAWVHLSSSCDPSEVLVCKLVAVSLDGSAGGVTTSKFRLGHLADRFQNPSGVWVFEMPESGEPGAPVTKAAVTVLPSDLGAWVHLAGVYDKAAGKLWLYVNGVRKGDGTLDTAWRGTGGLLIGRGRDADGAAAEFFPGTVDDVRIYSGLLDDDRISALYRSYPA